LPILSQAQGEWRREEALANAITLITDSSACVPPDAVRDLGIRVVPIQVRIAGDEFRDGVDLEPATLYAALERGAPVKSAAPTPLDYLDAIGTEGEGTVVIVTPAGEFTHMLPNATLAAEMSDRPVVVADSRSATAGHGLVVLAAAEAAAAGGEPGDVLAAAREAGRRVELVAYLETLDFLRQSGHVPAPALGLASHLQLKPVFRLRDGTAERVALARTERGSAERVARAWREGAGPEAGRTAVFHAGRPERARELAAMLGGTTFIIEFSAAMAIHTGPGVVGAAWVRPAREP
jgi:DegV family protein with EDD domain